jgi:iturin family lipopeptide synthetase A
VRVEPAEVTQAVRKLPGIRSGRGQTARAAIPGDIRLATEACARRHVATPAVAASALAVFLAALSGQTDVLLRVAYANRERREFESMVTSMVMTIGLRIRLDEAPAFGDLVSIAVGNLTRAVDSRLPLKEVLNALNEAGCTAPDSPSLVGLAFRTSLDRSERSHSTPSHQ